MTPERYKELTAELAAIDGEEYPDQLVRQDIQTLRNVLSELLDHVQDLHKLAARAQRLASRNAPASGTTGADE